MKRFGQRLSSLLALLLLAGFWFYGKAELPETLSPDEPEPPSGQEASKGPDGQLLPCTPYRDDGRKVSKKPVVPTLTDAKAPSYKVLRVVDGDTIVVEKNGKTTVRLMGVDTPEKSTTKNGQVEHFGAEASSFTAELIEASENRVRLTYDKEKQDKYGRDLAYVWLADGRLLNGVLIAEGYGYPYLGSRPIYEQELVGLVRQAKEKGLGLWAVCGQE